MTRVFLFYKGIGLGFSVISSHDTGRGGRVRRERRRRRASALENIQFGERASLALLFLLRLLLPKEEANIEVQCTEKEKKMT